MTELLVMFITYTVNNNIPMVPRVLILLLYLPNFGLILFAKTLKIGLSKIALNFGKKSFYFLLSFKAFVSLDQNLVNISNQLV